MNKCNSIECNSIGAIEKTDLSEQSKFRLEEIGKIENYFMEEINQKKSCSQKLDKYVTIFDYIDKILIFLSATTGASIIGAPAGVASASFTLIFSVTTKIVNKLLNIKRKKEKEKA